MRLRFIQTIIDMFRQKAWGMPEIADKFYGINRNPKIETLVLGTSHLMCGYLPKEGEYNLAFSSQDLYYSYELYKKYNNPEIKNIIISFSVFTPGHVLVLGSNAILACYSKLIFGIDYQYQDAAKKKKLYSEEKKFKKIIGKYLEKLNLESSYRGEHRNHNPIKIDEKRAEIIALKHYKNNQRELNQIDFCKKLIEATQENGQKLYFILPPALEIYKKHLPSSEAIFKPLYEVILGQKHVEVLNFYDSDDFIEEDFADSDHLNLKGAEKLTKMIHEKVYC